MAHDELQKEDIDATISPLHSAFKRTWYEFCNVSSIHGLKYAKDKETNGYIRFIWILITLIMLLCAIVMVLNFYLEYRSNPTRMNVENDHAPISSLIFPPTTICPEVMYNLQKSKDFFETLILPNSTNVADMLENLYYTYGFIYDGVYLQEHHLNEMEETLTLNKLSILDFIDNISWDCEDLFFRCRFKDKIVPCKELFQISQSFRGRCCSFNLNSSSTKYRMRYAHAGLRNGLSVILHYNDSKQDLLDSYSHGFKILVQETNAFPSAHSVVKFVPLDKEVFMAVRPTETFCSQAVKDLSLENRLCVLANEKKLKFFESYLGANCELNCRIERMLKLCDCYTFYFHMNRTNCRICSFKDIRCLTKNFATIIGRYKTTHCTCYRNCEKIEYDVQVTNAPLNLNTPTIDSFYDDIQEGYSVLHIYMNSQVYRRVRHDLLTNMVTLVSNLGSAFSLFVGMSMISVVEILYYFSIILKKYYQQECRARAWLPEIKNEGKVNDEINKQFENIKPQMVKVEEFEN